MGFEVRRIDVTGGLKFRGFRNAIEGAPAGIAHAKQLGLGVTYHVLRDGQTGIVRGRLDDLHEETLKHTLMPDIFESSHIRPSDLRRAEELLLSQPKMLERFTPVDVPAMNWESVTFGANPSRAAFFATLPRHGDWASAIPDPEVHLFPPGDFPMHPLSQALHYGMSGWEGGKAYRLPDGQIVGFRWMDIGRRFVRTITRLEGTPATPEFYAKTIEAVVRANAELVAPFGTDGALYIRPFQFGIGEQLGVNPPEEECLMVVVSPVGPYYNKKVGFAPIHLKIEEAVHRAWPGGIGNVKATGSYIIGMESQVKTKAKGFNENLYVNETGSGAEELGSGNFFTVRDGKLYTATLENGTILPGITRATIIEIAHAMGLEVIEDDHHLMGVALAQEAFVTGNAARITPVGSVTFRGSKKIFGDGTPGEITQKLYAALVAVQQARWDDPALAGIPREMLERWESEWLYRVLEPAQVPQPVRS